MWFWWKRAAKLSKVKESSFHTRTSSNPAQKGPHSAQQNPGRSTNKLYALRQKIEENGGWLVYTSKPPYNLKPRLQPPFKQGSARDKGAKSVATFPFHGTLCSAHSTVHTAQKNIAAHCSALGQAQHTPGKLQPVLWMLPLGTPRPLY